MERVAKFIQSLSESELIALQADIDRDSPWIKHYVKGEIQSRQTDSCKFCAQCGNDINPNNPQNFTLTFGPTDFRKKATLCGLDCTQQFMTMLHNIKEASNEDLEEQQLQ